MIGKLIERPIAVTMTIIAIVVLGAVAIGMLPVSLMPEVDIPRITVQVSAPGYSAREIDRTMLKSLKYQLRQVSSLKELRSEASNNSGIIYMEFEHGSDIQYLFVDVNEKIDKAGLPKELERPKVVKASATDIPAFFVNMTIENTTTEKFLELSRFASDVISKRIEQIPEVALVDMSGLSLPEILITPYTQKNRAMGVSESTLISAINANNQQLGNISIKDGHYQWDIRFMSEIRSKADIENINLNINGRVFKFKELAAVTEQPARAKGMARSDGKPAVCMAVVKQSDAKMANLKSSLNTLMADFNKEYPDVQFKVTRDQTQLLDYSISNLRNNILLGAILACLVIFFFLQDFRSPMLVTITIPLSLIVSLLFFFVAGISINIISLSGLILGIGMMVDNSIIVIDNITQMRERRVPLKEAVVRGVGEVFAPMLSSVLTTCSVFLPLIFLSGIAGALFYDQAMAVTIGLISSLLVAVLVIPVYYYLFYGKSSGVTKNRYLSKFQIFDYHAFYEKSLKWVFRHQRLVWTIFLLVIPATFFLYKEIDKSKLPPVTHDDTILYIDWNLPLNPAESDSRVELISKKANEFIAHRSSYIAGQQFILSHTPELTQSEAIVYIRANIPEDLVEIEKVISNAITSLFPQATFRFSMADNIFNMIFSDKEYNLVAKIVGKDNNPPDPDKLNLFLEKISAKIPTLYIEPVLWQEQILLVTRPEMLSLYKVEHSAIHYAIQNAARESRLFSISHGTYSVPIIMGDEESFSSDFTKLSLKSSAGVDIPLTELLRESRVRDFKSIVSGNEGDYYPLNLKVADRDVKDVMQKIEAAAKADKNFDIIFAGSYFSNRELIKELVIILAVALLLLFFILAAQFESLIQPLIILSEVVVDIFGAMLFLWVFGSGLNLMSMIGIVVMSGIIINDSILKVDTINRLRREGYSLLRAIITGGTRRLKPILMTSLTTILAIAPFLVRGDMGSDLQYPLSLALIGGMIVGTIVSIYFIPVFYYNIYKKRSK
ncbi:MAG: efflux RND transporter permease subunit [Bacteroidales bacterium]|nr:efflux RND transporter permease subunit [Bacteroidales bacterium]